jgi:hypothetical protein
MQAMEYGRRGIWIVEASYPKVLAVFASPVLQPHAVLFGAELDFTNYDLEPPSVTLLDPFSRKPCIPPEAPVLVRMTPGPDGKPVPQPVLQYHGDGSKPFLCLPGTREYHSHPAHTGDSWLLHRSTGEGTLSFLVDKLHEFGVLPIKAFQFGIAIRVAGVELG